MGQEWVRSKPNTLPHSLPPGVLMSTYQDSTWTLELSPLHYKRLWHHTSTGFGAAIIKASGRDTYCW